MPDKTPTRRQLEMLVNVLNGKSIFAYENRSKGARSDGGGALRSVRRMQNEGWIRPDYITDARKLTETGRAFAEAEKARLDKKAARRAEIREIAELVVKGEPISRDERNRLRRAKL